MACRFGPTIGHARTAIVKGTRRDTPPNTPIIANLYDGTDKISCKNNRDRESPGPRQQRCAPWRYYCRTSPPKWDLSNETSTTRCGPSQEAASWKARWTMPIKSRRVIPRTWNFFSFLLRLSADKWDVPRLLHTFILSTSSTLHARANHFESFSWTNLRPLFGGVLAARSMACLTAQTTWLNRNTPTSSFTPAATYVKTILASWDPLRCDTGLWKTCQDCFLGNAPQILSRLQNWTVRLHGCFTTGFYFTPQIRLCSFLSCPDIVYKKNVLASACLTIDRGMYHDYSRHRAAGPHRRIRKVGW